MFGYTKSVVVLAFAAFAVRAVVAMFTDKPIYKAIGAMLWVVIVCLPIGFACDLWAQRKHRRDLGLRSQDRLQAKDGS